MELLELDVVVGAATAFKALTSEMQEAVAALQTNDHESPAVDQWPPERLRRAIRRADLLASQMLAYAGAQPLAPWKLELLPFLSDLASVLRQTLDRRIEVVVNVGHDCPPCHADGDGLREALLNLVVNSRDAMPHGGTIQLSAKAAEAEDGCPTVAVGVTDNGLGMAAEFASLALRPFITTKVDSPHAGMGLAAADGFARQSGGHLELSCWAGGGLTATLLLPRALSALKVAASQGPLADDGGAHGGKDSAQRTTMEDVAESGHAKQKCEVRDLAALPGSIGLTRFDRPQRHGLAVRDRKRVASTESGAIANS